MNSITGKDSATLLIECGSKALAPLRVLVLLAFALFYSTDTLPADAPSTLLHVVDYIVTDYSGAVNGARIVSASEYREMRDFAGQVVVLIQALPEQAPKQGLLNEALGLQSLVSHGAPADRVEASARRIHQMLVNAYNIRGVPRNTPSLVTAGPLYQRYCSACHGAKGYGDGLAARGLNPPPANFHDAERMARRSVFTLYNSITQGVTGTAMAPFATLSDIDRWSLALFVSNLAVSADELKRSEQKWRARDFNPGASTAEAVFSQSREEVNAKRGVDGVAAQTYLKAHPDLIARLERPKPLAFAKQSIEASRRAYLAGHRELARQFAIQAYLDGFELIEARLGANDAALMNETERAMMGFRQQLQGEGPIDIEAQAATLGGLLDRAEAALDRNHRSASTSFASALLIIVREGLEALLVIAGILALLIRADRRDALPYVHAGWISAIVLGLATWLAATYVIDISGANRELTEGISALVAAIMLVYVGYWLHSRSAAGAWQRFIQQHVDSALARRSLWAMAFLAFITVYREMFETVLFYEALWIEAGVGARVALLGGLTTGIVLLGIIAFALLKYSVKVPLRAFFASTAVLICALAIVMAGEGIRALQEAGTVASTAVAIPTISWLGLFPTLQGLLVQLATTALVVIGFALARRRNA